MGAGGKIVAILILAIVAGGFVLMLKKKKQAGPDKAPPKKADPASVIENGIQSWIPGIMGNTSWLSQLKKTQEEFGGTMEEHIRKAAEETFYEKGPYKW